MEDDLAAANGFGRRSLRKHEAWALYRCGYPCPPDMRVPGASGGQGAWALSAGGIPVPPIPVGAEFEDAIDEVRAGLTAAQAAEPRWRAEGNSAFWTLYFQRRREQDLNDRGDNGPVEGRHNRLGRRRWWNGEGRTLENVMTYITNGNTPRLEMPPRRASWTPRRMGDAPSSSSGNSSSTSLTPPLLNSGRPAPVRSGALRVNEPRSGSQRRAASPPRSFLRRLVRPKNEPKPEPEEEEWPGLKEAEEASFNTVQPALPEWAEDWSLRSFAAEEVERQRAALADLERQRATAANAGRRSRIPPPPVAPEIEYYKLDPSDDDEDDALQQALLVSKLQQGDDGAGPSRPPGGDDGSDDDGDYSAAIRASLGLN